MQSVEAIAREGSSLDGGAQEPYLNISVFIGRVMLQKEWEKTFKSHNNDKKRQEWEEEEDRVEGGNGGAPKTQSSESHISTIQQVWGLMRHYYVRSKRTVKSEEKEARRWPPEEGGATSTKPVFKFFATMKMPNSKMNTT